MFTCFSEVNVRFHKSQFGGSVVTCGQTDMAKLIGVFFANPRFNAQRIVGVSQKMQM
jgi:hypothetical protein